MGLFSNSGRQRFCPAQVKDAQTGRLRSCQNPVSGSAKGCFQHPTGTSNLQPAITTRPPARAKDSYGHGHVITSSTIDFDDLHPANVRGTHEYIQQLELERDEIWGEREYFARTCTAPNCDSTVYPNQGCYEHGNAPGATWTAVERQEFDDILGDFQKHSAIQKRPQHDKSAWWHLSAPGSLNPPPLSSHRPSLPSRTGSVLRVSLSTSEVDTRPC